MAISNRTSTTANSGAAAATSLVINKPTSTASGDVLVATISVNGGTGITITSPAGWTLFKRTDSTTVLGQGIYYRVCDGTEGSTFTFTVTSCFCSGVIACYTGVDNNNPLAGSSTLAKTAATTSATFSTVIQTAETSYAVLLLTGRNTTASATLTTASTGFTKDGDTCTTATTFIHTATCDQHTTFGLPLQTTVTAAAGTFSQSCTDIDSVILLRPVVSAFTGGFSIDVATSNRQIVGNGTVSTAAFSTGYANELLICVLIGDASQVTSNMGVSGGGLTWTRQLRITSASPNMVHYVYTAVASSTLSSVTVTATDSGDTTTDWTILLYSLLGTNNAAPIGASASSFVTAGLASATVVTTAANSWVWATYQDSTSSGAPTLVGTGTVATMASWTDSNALNTYSYFRQSGVTVSSGTSITMNTTAPTGHNTGIVAFEILVAVAAAGFARPNVNINQSVNRAATY